VNPAHLEPVTHAENSRRGAHVKLGWPEVRAIRASAESNSVLGERYGVHSTTVSNVRTRRRWWPEPVE
jgi:hypothetical protein